MTYTAIERIDKFLKEKRYKRSVIEKATGLNPVIVSSIFKHKRDLKFEEYCLITSYFDLPFDYFLTEKNELLA